MKAVESRVKKDPLARHTASYEECIRMGIHSWKVRQDKENLTKGLVSHEEIKLSTFVNNMSMF